MSFGSESVSVLQGAYDRVAELGVVPMPGRQFEVIEAGVGDRIGDLFAE